MASYPPPQHKPPLGERQVRGVCHLIFMPRVTPMNHENKVLSLSRWRERGGVRVDRWVFPHLVPLPGVEMRF